MAGPIFVLLALGVGLLAGSCAAAESPVLIEAEKDGVDLLYAALASAVTAAAGWFGKGGLDHFRGKRNGAKDEEARRMAAEALQAIREHDAHCDERTEQLHGRINAVKDDVAHVRADVAFIRGRLSPRSPEGESP